MSHCYKCGCYLDGQIECRDCQEGVRSTRMDEAEMEKCEQEFKEGYLEIDWDKVKTLADVIAVLREADPIFIWKQKPGIDRVRKFLKPIE